MSERPSGWAAGYAAFAGVVLVIVGCFQACAELVAILNDEFFVVGAEWTFMSGVTTWGWIHLILGVVVLAAGFGILTGNAAARTVGVLVAELSAVVNFTWLPSPPRWSAKPARSRARRRGARSHSAESWRLCWAPSLPSSALGNRPRAGCSPSSRRGSAMATCPAACGGSCTSRRRRRGTPVEPCPSREGAELLEQVGQPLRFEEVRVVPSRELSTGPALLPCPRRHRSDRIPAQALDARGRASDERPGHPLDRTREVRRVGKRALRTSAGCDGGEAVPVGSAGVEQHS